MDSQPGCLPLLLLMLILGLGAYFVASSFSTTVEETAAPMQSPNGDWAAWPFEASPAP